MRQDTLLAFVITGTLLIASCTIHSDGIEAVPGAPACQLIFAEGIMMPAISGAKPVQPLKINGRTPSVLRGDHNQFTVPAGPVMVLIQGFGSGTSASSSIQFEGKPSEIYRFGHQPAAGGETTFVVIDSKGHIIGTSRKFLESTVSQAPMYMPTYR